MVPSIEEVRRALEENGFYWVDDPAVGLRIQEMDNDGFQFTSSKVEGWEFCEDYILNDTLVRTSLQSSYKACCLGYYRRIAADTGHVFQFRKGSDGPDILLVQLWGKGQKAVYFPGSHRIMPTSFRAANRLWEVVTADLTRAGIEGREITFKEGGLAIIDARLSLEMPAGDPVTAAFVGADNSELMEAELAKWPRLPLPNLGVEAIDGLEKRGIRVHHAIQNANDGDGKKTTSQDN